MKRETAFYGQRWRRASILALLFLLFSVAAMAQNTKGDKPAKPLPRVVQKTKAKPAKKDRAKTKDISGRKLRTKNKSSAVRAIQTSPTRRPNQPSRGDRAVRSEKPTIKSSTAKYGRNNVYPQSGPYVNNPSRKPKQKQPTYSNRSIVNKRVQNSKRQARANVYPQKGPYVNNPSKRPKAKQPTYSNKNIVNRNVARSQQRTRNNIYPQKGPYINNPSRQPKKNGKTIFNNRSFIAKALNLQSPSWPPGKRKGGPRSASGNYVTRGKKNVYWGKFRKGERAITTDIAGRPLRTKNYQSPAIGFVPATSPYAFRKKKKEGAYRGTFRFGFSSATRSTQRAWSGNISGHPLRKNRPRPTETAGQRVFPRKLSVSGTQKNFSLKGSGYQSRTGKRISNEPIPAKAPGIGASGILKSLNRITGRKTKKGGGSVTGKMGSNLPLPGKAPGIGAVGIGNYKGSYKKGALSPGFRDQGIGFSGSIKTKRPLKGGGSISGRSRNNNGNPVDVKAPTGKSAGLVGTFQGNIKGGQKSFRNQGEGFSGSIKAKKPLKGGGSISGRSRNNNGNPVDVKAPTGKNAGIVGTYQGNIKYTGKGFRNQGEEFSGNLKARRPLKGGGSISGRPMDNNGNPIDVKAPTGKNAGAIGTYQGNIKYTGKGFRNQGEEYTGNLKPKKKVPTGEAARVGTFKGNAKVGDLVPGFRNQGEEFTGFIKTKGKRAYVRNPNASELAIKQQRPDKTTYQVDGLHVKVKTDKYRHNKASAEGALLAKGPRSNSVKASEYSGKMKVFWNYKHNPSSSDEAQKAIAGSNSFYKATAFGGRVRMHRNYRHNPASDKEALKTFAPGRSYARINDFQGNFRMKKYGGRDFHPDTKFAHSSGNNVKEERTILTNVKLFWAKVFKKNSTQTKAVRQKVDRPRYDKRERELWKDLYD